MSNSISENLEKDLKLRLKKIEGQVRGIYKMIDKNKYCVDILTQIDAVRGALNKVALKVLDSHIRGCVQEALTDKNTGQKEEKLDELMDLLTKYTN